jgi:acyl-CoA thioesterase I
MYMGRVAKLIIFVIGFAWLNVAHAESIKIVCFGGSNTYGKNLPRSDAYPAQLEVLLKAKGYDVVVTNEGTNGQTTKEELGKLDSVVPNETSIVIFQPGGNDNNPKHLASITSTKDNIREIIQKLLDRKIDVIFSGADGKREFVKQFFDISMIDEINHLAPDNMQSDGSHLTPEGYHIVAVKMLPLVEQIIEKRNKHQ